EVPREVALVQADRLDGWLAGLYDESVKPHPRPDAEQGRPALFRKKPRQPTQEQFDWWARDGVLHGRRSESYWAGTPLQSRLSYGRPLRNGESVSCEFFYEPGAVHVHPALDRLAFLLEPGGVRLHWMTDGPDTEWTGLKADNVAAEPAGRRGPQTLPLQAGAWNRLKLALRDDTAVLELNGVTVYERKLEPGNNRSFGFFHYKDQTAVQVRNVVLRGDWPEALTADQIANLTAPGGETPLADRRA